jgi:hypothetical protein
MNCGSSFVEQQFPLPATGTMYYMTRDVRWVAGHPQRDSVGEHFLMQQTPTPVAFTAGRTYQIRWNGAVVGPSAVADSVTRNWHNVRASIPMFGDGVPGHVGTGWYDTGRTVLYRDGKLVTQAAAPGAIQAEVVMEPADYRLFTEVTRSSDVSTRITAAWTFYSGFTGIEDDPIPIMTVRFSPPVDLANTVAAGSTINIPVRVDGAVQGVQALAVQVSYDDGATWVEASLSKAGSFWLARVTNPATAGHVSLRVSARDGKGSTVAETIIRAYHVR